MNIDEFKDVTLSVPVATEVVMKPMDTNTGNLIFNQTEPTAPTAPIVGGQEPALQQKSAQQEQMASMQDKLAAMQLKMNAMMQSMAQQQQQPQ